MAKFFGKRRRGPSSRPLKPPLFERVQDWMFQIDTKSGTSLFRVGMFCLLVLFIILLYTGTQFYGLRDREAMDMAQIARNLARGHGYSTSVIRPFELAHLQRVGKDPMNLEQGVQPELITPPAYPLVLAAVFKVIKPSLEFSSVRMVKADRLVMVISWFFFLASLGLTYALAREMFDHRAAVLTLFLHLCCDPILDNSIAGLHLNFLMFLFVLGAYGVLKAEKWTTEGRSSRWTAGALAFSALAVGLGTLTQYAFGAVIVPLLCYVGVSFPKQWRRWVALCGAVLLVIFLPWLLRNLQTSRTLFGLSPYLLMEETGKGTEDAIRFGELQRQYLETAPPFELRRLFRKTAVNLHTLYETTLKDVGAGYLIAFFLVSLLHRWRREEVFRLRRFVFWSLIFTIGWLAVTGPPTRNFLIVFMPVIMIYAAAFFYVLFERLQFRTRIWRYGGVVLFVTLNSLPLVYSVLPPVTTLPNPPTLAPVSRRLAELFEAESVLASDMPWAAAWYADLTTVWLPPTDREYILINDTVRVISAIYFTTATQESLSVRQMVDAMSNRVPLTWQQAFPVVRPDAAFPLKYINALSPEQDQFLISNLLQPSAQ